eukprot:scaffold76001_cov30-Tisochrysis_lutea.AAC.1
MQILSLTVVSLPFSHSLSPTRGGRELPRALCEARAACAWPLDPVRIPPLHYEPLVRLPSVRRARHSLLSREAARLAEDVEGWIEEMGGSDHARVALACLLLGGGGADEAHALVTPLSWPEATAFGGPPVEGSEAALHATYLHALIHRREAFHVGEFGTGWHNSAFWFGSLASRDESARLLSKVVTAAQEAAAEAAQKGCIEAQEWCEENGLHDGAVWPSRAFNGLCNRVISKATLLQESTLSESSHLGEFAESVAVAELRLLLDECLDRCGYVTDSSSMASCFGLDGRLSEDNRIASRRVGQPDSTKETTAFKRDLSTVHAGSEEWTTDALLAVRRVSQVHREAFHSRGVVVVRSVLHEGSAIEGRRRTIASALAARLLNVRAVALESTNGNAVADAEGARTSSSAKVMIASHDCTLAGFDMSTDDAIVVHARAFGDIVDKEAAVPWLCFRECDPAEYAGPCWVDPLFGQRGESPTSVLQWSKGIGQQNLGLLTLEELMCCFCAAIFTHFNVIRHTGPRSETLKHTAYGVLAAAQRSTGASAL